jgi:hypothetical protein
LQVAYAEQVQTTHETWHFWEMMPLRATAHDGLPKSALRHTVFDFPVVSVSVKDFRQ